MGIFDFFKKKNKKEEVFQDIENTKGYEENIYENNIENQDEYEDEKYLTSNKISIISKFYEKLDNLSRKYETDLDIISLNALCATGINEENAQAISDIIERLKDRYPDEEEFMWLDPEIIIELEEISLEDLLGYLEKEYSRNSEIITVRALINLPNTVEKDKSIVECLKRLYKETRDEKLSKYFGYLIYTEQFSEEYFYENEDDDRIKSIEELQEEISKKYSRARYDDDEIYKYYY